MFCKNCGQEIENEATFCMFCGCQNINNKSVSKKKRDKKGNRVLPILLLLVVLSGIICGVLYFGDNIRCYINLQLAQKAYRAEEYTGALRYYKSALEIDDSLTGVYIKIADIYVEEEEYKDALKILEDGIKCVKSSDRGELEENLSNICEEYIEILLADNKYEKALKIFEDYEEYLDEDLLEDKILPKVPVAAETPAAVAEAPAAVEEAAPAEAIVESAWVRGNKIGVSMPTKDLHRWNQDGIIIKSQLEAMGYEVDLQYAGNDIDTQVYQVENMINSGCEMLVIAAIDCESLGNVLEYAKSWGIPIISYDRLIMNSDAVSYYVTFDNYMVGTLQGQYIKEQLNLDNAIGAYNIELTTGDPGDISARFFFAGAMDVLQPYINADILVVKSCQTAFEEVATANWATDAAHARMDAIIAANYSDGATLHACMCSNDSTALGVVDSLKANYSGKWPIITGQDCDIASVKNILAGKQSMSVFKDTRTLAAKAVEMVDTVMKGGEAPVNDTETYDNGTGIIPSYLCAPTVVDKYNYKEMLINSGYYKETELQ